MLGLFVASPSSRPAASDEVMTESAPLWVSRSAFSASRTAATTLTSGASCRTVRQVSTAVSSRLTAMTTARDLVTSASLSTASLSDRPCTVASPAAAALSTASWSTSMTTICSSATPF